MLLTQIDILAFSARVCPPTTMKNAVAGYIKINDEIYLYAVVEGVVSGQPCCQHHLFISNP